VTEPHLRTLREVAAEIGRTPRSARRLLRRAHDEDARSDAKPDWRTWSGVEGSPMLFNVSRLRRAHPEFFKSQPVDRAEFSHLADRVTATELGLKRLGTRVRALEPKSA
jgi:predicted transcriptional regulator